MRGAVLPGRTVRFATVMTVALLAGLLSGPASTAISGGGDGTTTLAYTCGFDSGTQAVSIAFEQTYPGTVAVGRPLAPGALTATVTIPRAGLTAMLPSPAATVSGTADLTVHITQGTSQADASWPGLTAPATPADGTDDLQLALAGTVPPLSVSAPGKVQFAAGGIALTLHPVAAAGTPTPAPTGTGTASDAGAPAAADTATPADTTPAPLADITGTCTPAAGQDALLATVLATGPATGTPAAGGRSGGAAGRGGTGSPTDGSTPGRTPLDGGTAAAGARGGTITLQTPVMSDKSDCPPPPTGNPDPAVLAAQAKERPEGATVYPGPDDPPIDRLSQCGFITGLSNVAKLNGASVINDLNAPDPPMANIATVASVFSFADPDHPYVELDSVADFTIPPSKTAFLTYGFMPTTATMRLTAEGPMTVITTGIGAELYVTTIYGKQDLRLTDVKVNGQPMDVGSGCRAKAPLQIKLVGTNRSGLDGVVTPRDYAIQEGGPLAQDDLYIPPFTGCRTPAGEDVSALFTSAISGHGNSLNLIQGPLCAPLADPKYCTPHIPYPVPPHR
ncbi:DUF6801 domain-containing protein [Actinacidiphila bryophytorum]|uniref:DUF6801 domain-containing protein n=2 Tax=Actinacidiphila bryophytorum TaxID=1436133 RepID=A0A9W4EA30_9ACTN|nr:DUF6801 domain-containing protein [Actinacidiphila bryophytorum]MBM9434849.1 hypothetical protein [Actinacidiphila bryophytorum]CAG7630830.1 conserved exported hypothetical protein [Actinacidiphila bryophytorum]